MESGRASVDPAAESAAAAQIEPEFLRLCYEYSRSIGDASRDTRPGLRLLSAGTFFEAAHMFVTNLDPARLEATLLLLLDDFSRLDEHSYNQMYLWCLVQLARMNPVHVGAFWPLVLDLDLRYRAEPWQRPDGVDIVDQPYRLTELVFYFYVINTLQRTAWEEGATQTQRPYASLASSLAAMQRHLSDAQWELMIDTLRELARTQRRPEFGDACGLLLRRLSTTNGS